MDKRRYPPLPCVRRYDIGRHRGVTGMRINTAMLAVCALISASFGAAERSTEPSLWAQPNAHGEASQ